jgi:hypothetical protein
MTGKKARIIAVVTCSRPTIASILGMIEVKIGRYFPSSSISRMSRYHTYIIIFSA